MISKAWNKLVKVVNQYFALTMIVAVIICMILGKYHNANYFLLLFLIFTISEGLNNIKRSVDMVWLQLYKQNNKEGNE